jgi:hypothetical protein
VRRTREATAVSSGLRCGRSVAPLVPLRTSQSKSYAFLSGVVLGAGFPAPVETSRVKGRGIKRGGFGFERSFGIVELDLAALPSG